ncbi:cell division protein FtsQ [Natranaerovirga pectinivora]|uniref:Cell division protein FtsQ n=1 Tax=Natranaerovirga pectinivora TaxID=682400 RepID=A0A4V6NZV0_9FIRM|nr:cell division protein FtsQ/DivIB [Natranaerovirga pectinivora]TCT16859.1 cell division protein FtsQ [Natranaerovirga pectinivora]
MKKKQKIKGNIVALKKSNSKINKVALLLFATTVIIIVYVFNNMFAIKSIYVFGNAYYSETQIIDLIGLNTHNNSLIYYLSSNQNDFNNIPLIEKINVKLNSRQEIHVEVFEKKVIGSIEIMGMYLYFDREGIIVETLNENLEHIPVIYGLNYDHVRMDEQIPVKDEKIFDDILNIIQILSTYKINIEEIIIKDDEEYTLVKSNIRVLLGTRDQLHEKINEFNTILPNLPDEKGELNLKNINHRIYFKKDI